MKSTRKAYGETLVELGKENENIIVLDADLSKATCTEIFKKEFPNRHINIGIAEQDMVGTACGLALAGKIVFASSFAMFLCGRAYEQIRNGVAYNHANVKLCATHSGLAVGEDGPTHQCLEDIALMRAIPTMQIYSPADETAVKYMLKNSININGPLYIRLGRSEVNDVYKELKVNEDAFELGKSYTFGEGIDGTIFATGITLGMALEAKEILNTKGINVRVVDIFSIKPIDTKNIIKCAKETKKLISIEDHSIIGGIGSAIAEVLSDSSPAKLTRLGIKDTFGKSGKASEVLKMYGITAQDIVKEFEG